MNKYNTMENYQYTIYCDTVEEVKECIESPEFIRPLLLASIREMMRRGCRRIISEVRTLDTYATINIAVNESEVTGILQKTLTWFEGRDEFEECSEVRDLMVDWTAYRVAKGRRRRRSAVGDKNCAKTSTNKRTK